MIGSTTIHALRDAYQAKHFSEEIFDLDAGYLQTSVENNDDRMPLQFFVDYNNMWWFELLHSVEVYHTSLDPMTGTGAIAFAVRYGDAQSTVDAIHGMQFLRFDEVGRINYIRTFANPSFWVDNPNPIVQLDALATISGSALGMIWMLPCAPQSSFSTAARMQKGFRSGLV